MKLGNDTLTIGQDIRLVFTDIIRWQTTLALTQAHTSARRMKAHPELTRGANLVIQAGPVGKQVQMVCHRRRTGEH